MTAWTSARTIDTPAARPARRIAWSKPLLFVAGLVPLALLVRRVLEGTLANPIEFITHATGDWTIRFIVITLAITPARKFLRRPALIRYRRMLGLFAFFYGFLHLMTYLWLDKFFDFSAIVKDVVKRPFITAGFAAFVLMVPLAATSTAGWIRRLGGTRWQALHRLIYLTAIGGVLHYYWLVKSDIRWPAAYGAMVLLLLGYRAYARLSSPKPARR